MSGGAIAAEIPRAARGGRLDAVTLGAFAVGLLLVAVAIAGPALAPYDPLRSDATAPLAAPNWSHWAGTDQIGRDVLSRLIVATRLDLTIAISAVLVSFAIGAVVGALIGYVGGWADRVISRAVDALMAFPLFVLAMALIAALGNNVANVIYATAIINLPFYIRFARAEVNARRGLGWVEAARLCGNSHWRIVVLFMLPHVMPAMMVQMSLNLGWAILNAAGLSFLGLGVQPPTPEWGIMVAEGARYISSGKWWLVACPGLALAVAVLCFNLAGDGLRDLLDPARRR